MFFRMLKKELREKIGFNIVLFVFMTVASLLTVASALQLYANFEGSQRTYNACNSSDVFLVTEQSMEGRSEQLEKVDTWLSQREDVAHADYREIIRYNSRTLDFDDFDEVNSVAFRDYMYYLFTLPQGQNTVVDMEDNSFVVESGCVAIPKSIQMITGTQIGEKIRITTQMGYVYEFTVSHIFKDPAVAYFRRIIVSESDYEILYNESPLKYDFYEIQQSGESNIRRQQKLIQDFTQENEEISVSYSQARDWLSADVVIAQTIAVFMLITGVFLILLILMTIRFTLQSAMKREEQELGMMKAIGVNNSVLKWIFAYKYIFFAVAGGVFGLVLGIWASNQLYEQLRFNLLTPPVTLTMAIAIGAVFLSTVFIICFTFVALHKMDRVSPMDALHGENQGERFHQIPKYFLHKRKRIRIPLFLALTDLIGRIKRYAFLLVAYVLGISIILLVVQLRDSVLCMEYATRYSLLSTYEFEIHLNEELHDVYYQKAGDKRGVVALVNQDLEDAGIPAVTECMNRTKGRLWFQDSEASAMMCWGMSDTADVTYRKGSVAPKLYSEVAVDYYTAERMGIAIGDTVSVEFDKRTEDGLTSQFVTEEFVVTGYFDLAGSGDACMVMGNDFDGGVVFDSPRFKSVIYAPESEKPYYIEKMREIYGDDYVWDEERVLKDMLGSYYTTLTLLRNVLSTVVVMVLILITVLYQNVFLEEEVTAVAFLKSLGIDNQNIKKWQYFRIMTLVTISFVAALILTATLGNWFVGVMFKQIVKMAGFRFIVNPINSFVKVPLVVFVVISIVLAIVLKPIEKIQIWRIRNE